MGTIKSDRFRLCEYFEGILMTHWRRDIRFGFRMLANNKRFTAVAILALALGIGPNVAIFSVIWATFLAPEPYPHANRLAVVWTDYKGERGSSRADDYLQYLSRSKSFQHLDFFAWQGIYMTPSDPSEEPVSGQMITPGFFSQNLGIGTALGRDLLPEDGIAGNDHVVLLSHHLWQTRFHSDPNILGRQIKIDGEPYAVVGVLEPSLADGSDRQFTVPLALDPGRHNPLWGNIFGLLKPGATLAQAQAELSVIDRQLVAARGNRPDNSAWAVAVDPMRNDWLDKKMARDLWLLLAAVAFVLLIACANVANLLLAKGSSRQQEIAVRAALGATPRQVFAQLITESLTLTALGGAVGIGLGWALLKIVVSLLPGLISQVTDATQAKLNLPVLLFATGVTMLSGILFGCAPAWHAAQLNVSETLKQGSQGVVGGRRMRTQRVLVTAEVALALTLLAGAGMAVHSFWNISQIDLGFRTDHILTADLQRPRSSAQQATPPASPPPEQVLANNRQLIEKLRAIPGVEDATLTSSTPLQGYNSLPFDIAGRRVSLENQPVSHFQLVSPGYFGTFGIRLVRGRFLDETDTLDSPAAVIVNESFVRRYLPDVDPLSQRLLLPQIQRDKLGPITPRQIVGVFHDTLDGENLTETAQPEIFAPLAQDPHQYDALAVRTSIDPASVTGGMRAAVAAVYPGARVNRVQTMEQIVDAQVSGSRFGMVLFAGFAALALLLAALGIYGVMAFAAAQRCHEIGLRMALGAQPHHVIRLMVSDGLRMALLGLGIGLVGVIVLGRLMRSTLYGIPTFDFVSFSAVALALLGAALLASYLPARRSARVDPMVALRQQ
jgi:putative ABC transport system permease protein